MEPKTKIKKRVKKLEKKEKILEKRTRGLKKPLKRRKVKKSAKTVTHNSMKSKIESFNGLLSSYQRAILFPEKVQNAKVPSLFPLPTNSYHLKTTVKFATNASGNAAIVINPWFLSDSANAGTWILINNDATLDLATTGLSQFKSYSMSSTLTPGAASAYRLVSAAVTITPEIAPLNASGFIAGGIVTACDGSGAYAPGGSGFGPLAGNAAKSSVIDQALYYQKAELGSNQALRMIYLPFDPTFDMYVPPNKSRIYPVEVIPGGSGASGLSNMDQFFWNAYVTGVTGAQNFVLDIYYNFELEPAVGGVLQNFTTVALPTKMQDSVLEQVARSPSAIVMPIANKDQVITKLDEDFLSGKPMSFLGSTINFLKEHGPGIIGLLNTIF